MGAYRTKNIPFSVERTTVFIAAEGKKLTFFLVLLPEDLHYTEEVVLLFSFRKLSNDVPNEDMPKKKNQVVTMVVFVKKKFAYLR